MRPPKMGRNVGRNRRLERVARKPHDAQRQSSARLAGKPRVSCRRIFTRLSPARRAACRRRPPSTGRPHRSRRPARHRRHPAGRSRRRTVLPARSPSARCAAAGASVDASETPARSPTVRLPIRASTRRPRPRYGCEAYGLLARSDRHRVTHHGGRLPGAAHGTRAGASRPLGRTPGQPSPRCRDGRGG